MKATRRTHKHKILSTLLCCVILLGLLPTTALAVNITQVNVTIDAPQAGQPLDFTPGGDTNQYMVGSNGGNVRWYDTTGEKREVLSGAYAQAGHSYSVEIAVYAEPKYSFTNNTYGSINGTAASVTGGSGVIYLETSFVRLPEVIDKVLIGGINTPRPGMTPNYYAFIASDTNAYKISTGTKGNFTNGVYWYDVTAGKLMAQTDTFVKDHKYRIFIDLVVTGSNAFATQSNGAPAVEAKIDGKQANVSKYMSEPASKEINVYLDYTPESLTISKVAVNGLSAPVHGKAPDYTVELENLSALGTETYTLKDTNNVFVKNGINWYDETGGYDMTATDTFIAGHTYTATVYLVPTAGWTFASGIPGTVNGSTASVSGSGPQVAVKYTFPALAINQITSVAIEGITAPALGQFPSYVGIMKGQGYQLKDRNDAYYKNGICWSVMDSSNLPASGGTKFEGGKKYQITMYLVAQAGYEFAASSGGKLNVKATVNGKATAEVSGNKNEIVVTYYFPEATDNAAIPSAAVTGIDAPVIGAAPDYTADIVDGRYTLQNGNSAREKNGITWINNKTGNAMNVGAVKFEAGVSYSVVIGVTAKDGYAFQTDRTGAPTIAGTVNGQTAEVSGQDKYNAYLKYTFETLSEKKTLSSITVTKQPSKVEYVVGNSFDPAGMVVTAAYSDKSTAAVTGYTVAPHEKLTVNDKSVTISYTEDSVTKTATVPITVNPAKKALGSIAITKQPNKTEYASGNTFDPTGMVVTATYGDQTTAVVTGYIISPSGKLTSGNKSVTISYTEGDITKTATVSISVKAKMSNNFTDVKQSDYFYDPVLWAIEMGVTYGTSATTFSPHTTCSQAHILTFLWRAVGSPEPTIASPYSNTAVKSDQYFYKAFVWAWEKGLIGNTAHDPNTPCSRSDVVTYLWKLDGSPKTGYSNFTDVPASAPYAQAVAWAVQNGVTYGTSATTFSPDATCTRGQIVTFLWRYMNI